MKRMVLILGGAAAMVAGVTSAVDFAMMTSPHYPFSFGFGMLLSLPAHKLSSAFGVEGSANRSLWAFLEIGSDTLLGFGAGLLFGCVLYKARRLAIDTRSKDEERSG